MNIIMNGLQVFTNSELGELGVLQIDGKEYFPATACAKALEYKEPKSAIKQHCRWGVKHTLPHPQSPNKEITMNFIPIGDLLRLITHSKMEKAQQYESWVFDEVLPTIHMKGSYNKLDSELIVEIITKTVSVLLDELEKRAGKTFFTGNEPTNISKPVFDCEMILQPKQSLKVENFPTEFQDELNDLFQQMKKMESINYSAISRYCYAKGFPVSNVSLRRYFDRYFRQ